MFDIFFNAPTLIERVEQIQDELEHGRPTMAQEAAWQKNTG
jgi:LPS sulfotransferase NodH